MIAFVLAAGNHKPTVFDSEPVPGQGLSCVGGSKCFTKMDPSRGYWQIPISKDVKSLRLNMARISCNNIRNVEISVDDVLIHAVEWEQRLETLRRVLNVLKIASFTVRPSKTEVLLG